jgi:DNA modification methylase
LKELLGLDDRYDVLLTREAGTRRVRQDFPYKHDCYVVRENGGQMKHPSEKPLCVVEHLVQCVVPKGGILFDGFCGSGTTALAAAKTGRNFVCCDVSEEYCQVARERLKEEGLAMAV